jgi:hypothetical protein
MSVTKSLTAGQRPQLGRQLRLPLKTVGAGGGPGGLDVKDTAFPRPAELDDYRLLSPSVALYSLSVTDGSGLWSARSAAGSLEWALRRPRACPGTAGSVRRQERILVDRTGAAPGEADAALAVDRHSAAKPGMEANALR